MARRKKSDSETTSDDQARAPKIPKPRKKGSEPVTAENALSVLFEPEPKGRKSKAKKGPSDAIEDPGPELDPALSAAEQRANKAKAKLAENDAHAALRLRQIEISFKRYQQKTTEAKERITEARTEERRCWAVVEDVMASPLPVPSTAADAEVKLHRVELAWQDHGEALAHLKDEQKEAKADVKEAKAAFETAIKAAESGQLDLL